MVAWNEAKYQYEIKQAWRRLKKAEAPPKKRGKERGKGIQGKLLVELVAYAARDSGLIVVHRSQHRRSFYLKKHGSQFKLRISDHKYSGFSKQRHMSVILDHIVRGPMDSKDAIALGRKLKHDYAEKIATRLLAAVRE